MGSVLETVDCVCVCDEDHLCSAGLDKDPREAAGGSSGVCNGKDKTWFLITVTDGDLSEQYQAIV